jgi:hypothetical protein
MSIQKDRLHTRKQRIATIQMTPSGLDHSYFWVGEEMDGAFQQIRLWDEIGVKYANEFALRSLKPYGQRASLEAGAINSMNALDAIAALT